MINTGEMLLRFITKNHIPKGELGAKIGRNSLSILNYTRNDSIQTKLLVKICHATKHNFFRDIADQLPEDYTFYKPVDRSELIEKEQLIAQLQEENKVLRIQNELLMKIKG